MQHHSDREGGFIQRTWDSVSHLIVTGLVVFLLLGLIGIRHSQAGFVYEASRVLESVLRWMVSDKNIDWGEFEEVEPLSPEDRQERMDDSI